MVKRHLLAAHNLDLDRMTSEQKGSEIQDHILSSLYDARLGISYVILIFSLNICFTLRFSRELDIEGDASVIICPLIGGLFTCHKNPSAPSALIRPLNALRRLMRCFSKSWGSFEAGKTLPGHICVLINLV